MGLSKAIEKLEKIERLTRGLKIPSLPAGETRSAAEVQFLDQLITALRKEDKTSITIALLIDKLISKYAGRSV